MPYFPANTGVTMAKMYATNDCKGKLIWDYQQSPANLPGNVKGGMCLGLSHHWLCIKVSSSTTMGHLNKEVLRNIIATNAGAAQTQVDLGGTTDQILNRQVCDHVGISRQPEGIARRIERELIPPYILHGNACLLALMGVDTVGHAIAISIGDQDVAGPINISSKSFSYVFDPNFGEYRFNTRADAVKFLEYLMNNVYNKLKYIERVDYRTQEITIPERGRSWVPKFRIFKWH